MKKILLLLCLLAMTAQAQDGRKMIKGEILVPDGNSKEGITVFNASSNKGTITDAEGAFTIAVGLKDRVVFSALQYNDVIVIIDEGILSKDRMRLELVENLTILDNVTVTPYDLSGNIVADVGRSRLTRVTPFQELTLAEIENDYEISADAQTSVTNDALGGFNFQNGINFVNIFKALFKRKDRYKIDENAISPNVDATLRTMYNDDFFKENLNLKMEEIGPFIFYAEKEGLTAQLFEKGRELDLIEFLLAKSKSFKTQKD